MSKRDIGQEILEEIREIKSKQTGKRNSPTNEEKDYDSAKAALARGKDELIPSEVVYAILDGENAIKVWREYRGLSQQETAEKAGISVPYLSQLETSKRKGSLDVLSAVAKTLNVSLETILPAQS